MDQQRKRDEERRVIDAIFDLLYESEELSSNQIDDTLKQFGVDPQQIQKEGLALVRDLKRKIMFEKARGQDKRFKELKARISQNKEPKSRRKSISDLLMPSSSDLQLVFNRKLNKLSDEYLESLDNDKALLELWNSLDDCQ